MRVIRAVRKPTFIVAAVVAALRLTPGGPSPASAAEARPQRTAAHTMAALPLRFESNVGQTDERALFIARGVQSTLFLTPKEAVLAVADEGGGQGALRMSFAGARGTTPVMGEQELPGRTHYLRGPESEWRRNVASYARVRYEEMYPGVDVVFYGRERELEFDVVLAPGADPSQVALDITGARAPRLDGAGNLVLDVSSGEVRMKRPVAYQEIRGQRRSVESAFVLSGDRLSFRLGDYDRSEPLVIDPVVAYSTFLGGNGQESVAEIGVDAAGNVYVAGTTTSTNFPAVAAFDNTLNTPGPCPACFVRSDAFVAKLTPSGSALIYSTYLGGNQVDEANGLAVDAAGHAYVVGRTFSSDFPVTAGAFDSTPNGAVGDGFLAKLAPDGSSLLYSTVMGPAGSMAQDVDVDDSGGAYVLGYFAPGFPTTADAFCPESCGGASLVRFNTLASGPASLEYSTYTGVGGDQMDALPDGNVYIVSQQTLGFPAVNGFQTSPSLDRFGIWPTQDATLLRVNTRAASPSEAIVYGTYIGGMGGENGDAISARPDGTVCIAGYTDSPNFPTRRGFQPGHGGRADGFAAVFDTSLTGDASLLYSTLLGGIHPDVADRCSLGVDGSLAVVGQTQSPDFPLRAPFQPEFRGGEFNPDAFVLEIDPRLDGPASLVHSSYFGGTQGESQVYGLHRTAAGGLWIAGQTSSADLPLRNPIRSAVHGGTEVFLLKLEGTGSGGTAPAFVLSSIAPARGGEGLVTVAVHGTGFVSGTSVLLRRSGEQEAAASVKFVSDAALQTVFDLTGVAHGPWDVVLTHPDGRTAVLAGGFAVEPRTPMIRASVSVMMNPVQRAGRPSHGYITYSNPTNVDLILPLFLYFPRGTTMNFGIPIRHGQSVPGAPPLDFSQIPQVFDTGTEQVMPLIVNVPPGYTGVIPFTIPEGCDPFNPRSVRVAAGTPRPTSETMGCALALASLVFGVLPLGDCVGSIVSLMMDTVGHFTGAPASLSSWIADLLWASIDCFIAVNPGATVFAAAINITQVLMTLDDGAQVLWECGSPIRSVGQGSVATDRSCVFSADPNAKYGPAGAGEARHVTGADAMSYAVTFENLPTATAAAQDVVVTDTIDASRLDPATFTLGPISFGGRLVTPPPGLATFVTTVDLRPAVSLLLRIDAGLDRTTNVATWRFTSLDPATGQPTTDPLLGFLPPNVDSPEGEGTVTFSAAPVASLPTGDVIRNRASIVFDVNAPILTGEWTNAVDTIGPTSSVAPFSGPRWSPSFEVHWSGADSGSGIADYTVYVAENGGPFTPWLTHTTATSSLFVGTSGHTYSFFSVARDLVGHLEAAKTVAEATVEVLLDTEPPVLALPAHVVTDATSPAGAVVTFAAAATDNSGAVSMHCAPASGGVFPIGTTAVACTATDGSGNGSTSTFDVTVLGAAEQLVDLVDELKRMPLSAAARARLLSALTEALAQPRKVTIVCRVLRVFIGVVQLHSGRTIPATLAAELTADAARIRAVLGCGQG